MPTFYCQDTLPPPLPITKRQKQESFEGFSQVDVDETVTVLLTIFGLFSFSMSD